MPEQRRSRQLCPSKTKCNLYTYVLRSAVQVVETSNYDGAASTIVDAKDIGAPGTDVTTCKSDSERLLAVATQGIAGKQAPGRVILYTVGRDGKLTLKREYSTVGSLPDQVTFTKDCRHIIAAIEGEAVPLGNSIGKRRAADVSAVGDCSPVHDCLLWRALPAVWTI